MNHADGARLNETERSEPVNELFANYVQSTAFSLSLSRNMVHALINLNEAIQLQHERSRRPIHDGGINALVRRGLATVEQQPRRYVCRNPKAPLWSETATITTAGKLTLALLAEAGIAPAIQTAFPPPPPGWTDPRPKLKADAHGTFVITPSERELAGQ